jgi:glycyl-tRNA synthetase beta chain
MLKNYNINDVVFEINVEEMPYMHIESTLKQMVKFITKSLYDLKLKHGNIESYCTHRRLVLIIKNVCEKSEDYLVEILGPSLFKAKNIKGEYTDIAISFARKNKIKPCDLVIKIFNKKKYISFIKKKFGIEAIKILSVVFPKMIKSLHFQKTMGWGNNKFKFIRPIKNILALYGEKVIDFEIAGIFSSNYTEGSRSCYHSKIIINSSKKYMTTMRKNFIIVDQNERFERIKMAIKVSCDSVGNVVINNDLLNEINYLIEYPSVILCKFNKKYIVLPEDIIKICIEKKQKCFIIHDRNNKISNYFVCVQNCIFACKNIIRNGYENSVNIKLEDVKSFYLSDLKSKIDDNIGKLKNLVFHEKIGTIYEKVERIRCIAKLFNEKFNICIDNVLLDKAVTFSKIDLASKTVFEYPELKGIIGKMYALNLCKDLYFANAIEQHYWPLNDNNEIPSNKIALVLSLSDKLDTLISSFSIGIEYSGSLDPYGLKKIGTEFIKTVINGLLSGYGLINIIKKSFEFLQKDLKNKIEIDNVFEKFIDFLYQRIENFFCSVGYDICKIRSILSILKKNNDFELLCTIKDRLIALKNINKSDLLNIISIFKRINNVTIKEKKENIHICENIDEKLFVVEEEKILYYSSIEIKRQILSHISNNNYNKIFDEILKFNDLINNFFKKVFINIDDKNIKINRVSLLEYIKNVLLIFVDFSKLQ